MKINYKIDLEPVSFIAGDYQEFQYTVQDSETNLPVSLTGMQTGMALYPYGDNENPVAYYEGTNNGNTFLVKIPSETTKEFNGLYVQQPIIVSNEETFRPGQGTVNIYPRVFEEKKKYDSTRV